MVMQFVHQMNRGGLRVRGSTLIGDSASVPINTNLTGTEIIEGLNSPDDVNIDVSGGLVPLMIFNEQSPFPSDPEWEVGLYAHEAGSFGGKVVRGAASGSIVLDGYSSTNFVNFSTGDKKVLLVDPAILQGRDINADSVRALFMGIDSSGSTPFFNGVSEYLKIGSNNDATARPFIRDAGVVASGHLNSFSSGEERFNRDVSTVDNITPVRVATIETSASSGHGIYVELDLVGFFGSGEFAVINYKTAVLVASGTPSLITTPVKSVPLQEGTDVAASSITGTLNGSSLELDITSGVNAIVEWEVSGRIVNTI